MKQILVGVIVVLFVGATFGATAIFVNTIKDQEINELNSEISTLNSQKNSLNSQINSLK